MSARHPAGQSDFTLISSAYRPATPLSNHRSFPRTVPLVVGRIYRCWTCVYYSYLEPRAASVTVFAVYHTAGINSISAPGIPSYTSTRPYNQLSPTGSCLCKSATRYWALDVLYRMLTIFACYVWTLIFGMLFLFLITSLEYFVLKFCFSNNGLNMLPDVRNHF